MAQAQISGSPAPPRRPAAPLPALPLPQAYSSDNEEGSSTEGEPVFPEKKWVSEKTTTSFRRFFNKDERTAAKTTESSRSGLRNGGNKCYVNSIMQCISVLSVFTSELSVFVREPIEDDGEHFSKGQSFAKTLLELFQSLNTVQNGQLLDAHAVHLEVCDRFEDFTGNEQQDASEFFLACLESLNTMKGKPTDVAPVKVFQGQWRTEIECHSCRTRDSNRPLESFLMWPVNILRKQEADRDWDISELLACSCTPEEVERTCGFCGGTVASKSSAVEYPPKVLAVQLKRFFTNSSSNGIVKMYRRNDGVRYAKELTLPSHPDCKYELRSVLYHFGKFDSGHYTADVLAGGQWWNCNDSYTQPIAESEVFDVEKRVAVFMLFYEKVESPMREITELC
eukprot:ANDGO_05400.mRNA.1 Ubiquitin carboxyl-terminal hydrolase 23